MTDLTWIASYPRSGNTWLRFLIVNALVEEQFDWLTAMKSFAFELGWYEKRMLRDGWTQDQVIEKVQSVLSLQPTAKVLGERVFFKTHQAWSEMHPLAALTTRAVLLVRDPRDVLLSGLNFARLKRGYAGTDLEYAETFIEHGGDPAWIKLGDDSWSAHYSSWTQHDDFPVHILKYEDLKANPERELARLLEFLELPLEPKLIETAAERASLSKLRNTEIAARSQGELKGFQDGYYFVNKGRSGQSLDELSPGLDAKFEERFGADLAELGYTRTPAT